MGDHHEVTTGSAPGAVTDRSASRAGDDGGDGTGAGLVVARHGAVAEIRLDRPARGNALTSELAAAVTEALREADRDRSARAVLLTGTGTSFCTGADLSGARPAPSAEPGAATSTATSTAPVTARTVGPAGTERDLFAVMDDPAVFYELITTAWEVTTPVVCAMNGSAYGLGLVLALTADVVIAASGASVAQIYTERAMPAHAGEAYVYSRRFPAARLAEFGLQRRRYCTDDLERWHVINQVVPAESVYAQARAVATELAAGPTLAMAATKRQYRLAPDQDLHAALRDDRVLLAANKTTVDQKEGIRAFLERRDPRYEGR